MGSYYQPKTRSVKLSMGVKLTPRENILAAKSKIPLPESPKNVEKYPRVSCISKMNDKIHH